jgi:hypothetical protein
MFYTRKKDSHSFKRLDGMFLQLDQAACSCNCSMCFVEALLPQYSGLEVQCEIPLLTDHWQRHDSARAERRFCSTVGAKRASFKKFWILLGRGVAKGPRGPVFFSLL